MNEARPASGNRIERLAPFGAGALLALPVLLAHYLPMSDLPLHEAIVGLLRHWGDPSFVPPDVYELNLGLANQLFYFLVLALSYVVPLSLAMRIVVALAVFGIPAASAKLADHLGVTRWAAVLVAPLALGWMFFWGLLANLLGLDVYIFALPFFDRFCERPTGRGLAIACAYMVLLHFMHDLMALTAAGTIVLFTACSWRGWSGWKVNAVRFVPPLLVVALALSSRIIAARITNRYHSDLPDFSWYGPWHKLITIPGALYAGYEWWIRLGIFVVCNVPVALFAFERYQHRGPRLGSWKERIHTYRFELLCASLFVSYLVAPVNMKGTTLIYHRFLAPVWILLTLTACARGALAHPMRLPRLIAPFVPLAPLLTAWPRFVDSDRVYKGLDAVIARMDKGSTYIVLELGPVEPNWLYSAVTGGGHVVAMLGGRGFFDFTHSEASPVYQRLDRQWSTGFKRLDAHAYSMMPAYDFTHYRYAIIHTTDINISDLGVLAMQPEGRFLCRQGDWTVVESTLPLVPINSPDEPTPVPHPRTLRKRIIEVRDKILSMPDEEQVLPPESLPALQPAPQ